MLDQHLVELTAQLGFARIESLRYGRPMHEATCHLSFPCRLGPANVFFTMIVGLRFHCLARWLEIEPDDGRATLAQPINLLRSDTRYTEWPFSNSEDIKQLTNSIVADITTYALPFADRYSQAANLRAVVESPKAVDWVEAGLNDDRRITFLAAMQLIEGDRCSALRTLESALTARQSALPKHRTEIEYLRKRILADG